MNGGLDGGQVREELRGTRVGVEKVKIQDAGYIRIPLPSATPVLGSKTSAFADMR